MIGFAERMLALGDGLDGGETRLYRMPFLRIALRSADPGWTAACDRALADAEGQPAGGRLRVAVLEARAVPPDRPDRPAAPEGAFAVDRRLQAAGLRGAFFEPAGMWTFCDTAAGRGVQVLRHPGGWPPWEPSAPLRLMMAWSALAAGRLMVHAGTLGRNGRGVLIAGRGGSGKSGTTIAGLMAGLDSAGDDYVLVDPPSEGSPGHTAYPLYRIAKQDRAGFARLGLRDRLGDSHAGNWQGKVEFDIAALQGGRLAPLRLGAILLPRPCHGPRSRLIPAGAREAMLALAPSSIFQLPGDVQGALRLFAGMVRVLPAYRLELGTDPQEIAGTVAEFLERMP